MCCEQCFSDYPLETLRGRDGDGERPELISKSSILALWNAPEVYVTLDSDGIYESQTTCVLDVLGLRARRLGVAVVKVMTGHDSRGVRVLVPDVNVLDQGFRDVTLVDMGDVKGPDVSVDKLSILRQQWPFPVVSGMARQQLELEQL